MATLEKIRSKAGLLVLVVGWHCSLLSLETF